jgi:hypothetical protein
MSFNFTPLCLEPLARNYLSLTQWMSMRGMRLLCAPTLLGAGVVNLQKLDRRTEDGVIINAFVLRTLRAKST